MVGTVPTLWRAEGVADQRDTPQQILDAIEAMAAERDATVGIALDEFQEIHRFGGEDDEWHLRGVIQNHDRISSVLAGSQEALIRRMVGEGRAFYGMRDVLKLGPIDPNARDWILSSGTSRLIYTPFRGVNGSCRLFLEFLEPLGILSFDRGAAEHHGRIRHELRHQPIGERDLLIAAIAIANELPIATGNVREFERVSGLEVEAWRK